MSINKKWLNILLVSSLILLTIAVYYNSLFGDFLVDDDQGILFNERIHDLGKYFSHYFKFKEGVVAELTTATIWHFFPGQPFWFHLYSVAMYCVCVVLTFIMCFMLFGDRSLAFLTALIFAIHPIHTESVSWISAHNYIRGGIFYFAIFALFLKTLKSRKYIFVWCIFFILSLFFSREASMAVVMIVVYRALFQPEVFSVRKYIVPFICVCAISLTIVTLTLYEIWSDKASFFYAILHYRGMSYLIVAVKAFAYYIKILFFPIHRGLYHPFGFTTFHIQYVSPLFFVAVGLIAGLFTAMIANRKSNPAVSFGIAWFFVTFLPYSNIVPICNIVSERYLFLPVFGFSLVLSALYLNAWKVINRTHRFRSLLRGFALALLSVFLLSYSLMTVKRNFEYRNPFIYWETNIKNFPDGYRLYNNLAGTFYTLGKPDTAFVYCRILLSVNPYQANVWVNMGRIYEDRGQVQKAIECYRKALSINPRHELAQSKVAALSK